MIQTPIRLLILACGNTLRGDDGVGPWLAEWAERRFHGEAGLRIRVCQQWTPELAEEIAGAESVLFIDCAVDSAPGVVRLAPVVAAENAAELATHHLDATQLLALARALYNAVLADALQLTIGASATEMGEEFSEFVKTALPEACALLERTVLEMIASGVN